MKKIIRQLIPVILVILLMSGCSSIKNKVNTALNNIAGNTAGNIPTEEQTFSGQFRTVSKKPIDDEFVQILYLNSLLEAEPSDLPSSTPMSEDDILKKFLGVKDNWPAEYLSLGMPEYTSGKISEWYSQDDKFDISIIINDTNQAELDKYILELKANGFYDNYEKYCKGPFSITFELSSEGRLWISSYKENVVEWPVDILGFMPPLEKGCLVNINLNTEDDIAYGDLYFIDLSEEDIENWEETLKNAGFKMDGYRSYTMENVTLKGKRYKKFRAFFEDNGINEWSLYFSFK